MRSNRSRIALAALLLAAGCSAPGRSGQSAADPTPPPSGPAPWTGEFTRPAVLVAERVRIEGPPQLLDHLAVRADETNFAPDAKTLPEGFLQTWRRRPGTSEGEVRAFLDASQVVALDALEVLARPGWREVTVVGSGDVLLSRPDEPERRGPELGIRAPIEPR